jgi:uncharacterized membrane protein SpoIIM required for sporulation
MRVVDRLAERQQSWRELQKLLFRIEGKRIRRVRTSDGTRAPRGRDLSQGLDSAEILRMGELYRASCADLMLAESHDLPRDTVASLHTLVGRAHNAVYRTTGFRFADWAGMIFVEVPRRLRADPMLRVAAMVFWGLFLLTGFLGAGRPGFAASVLGGVAQLDAMEHMYETPMDGSSATEEKRQRNDSAMAGYYIIHNAGIGLSCYAWGLAFCVGSLMTLASNAIGIGAVFGHMATTRQAVNFYTFVTAHGPFELTAVVFAGAAGLRLGWGWIDTQGQSRMASLEREARRSLPFIEGFISASALPYAAKAAIAILSTILLGIYLFGLGRTARPASRDQPTLPPLASS